MSEQSSNQDRLVELQLQEEALEKSIQKKEDELEIIQELTEITRSIASSQPSTN